MKKRRRHRPRRLSALSRLARAYEPDSGEVSRSSPGDSYRDYGKASRFLTAGVPFEHGFIASLTTPLRQKSAGGGQARQLL